jgi:hypothetical protein
VSTRWLAVVIWLPWKFSGPVAVAVDVGGIGGTVSKGADTR